MTIDLWLAAGSYLLSPEGRRYRVIHGLDELARQMIAAGIMARWGQPPDGKAACSYWWRCEIVLAPWLFDCKPDDIRYALSHEMAHCRVGRSCARAHTWQQFIHAELLQPVPMMI